MQGWAHLGCWEGEGASHLHARQRAKCAHTCLHIWVPKGVHIWRTLRAQLGRGEAFPHLGHRGSPGCSHLGDAAAFRPTAGEVPDVTAGHAAEGTAMLGHIWRTRWFPFAHIWGVRTSGELAQACFSTPRAALRLQTGEVHIWTSQPHQHPLGSPHPTGSARCPLGNTLFICPLEPGTETVNKY